MMKLHPQEVALINENLANWQEIYENWKVVVAHEVDELSSRKSHSDVTEE